MKPKERKARDEDAKRKKEYSTFDSNVRIVSFRKQEEGRKEGRKKTETVFSPLRGGEGASLHYHDGRWSQRSDGDSSAEGTRKAERARNSIRHEAAQSNPEKHGAVLITGHSQRTYTGFKMIFSVLINTKLDWIWKSWGRQKWIWPCSNAPLTFSYIVDEMGEWWTSEGLQIMSISNGLNEEALQQVLIRNFQYFFFFKKSLD